ncbi:MAG: tetratricopeptide repeat protein [Bacteroidales bacterium]
MAKGKNTTKSEKNIIAVEEALGKSEKFIERNQNMLIWVIAIIVLLIGGYIGYNRFILEPKEVNAAEEMFMAEKFFEEGEFELALEGNEEHLGFLDIIDDYGITKTANLANYYSGICYLNLGEFENAIEYLEEFKKRDQMLGSFAYGAMGDAYLEMDNKEKALNFYKEAAEFKPNMLTSPMFLLKAGQLAEHMELYDDALAYFEKIKTEYNDAAEAKNIDVHIGRVKGYNK